MFKEEYDGKIIMINLISRWCDICKEHINMFSDPAIKDIIKKKFHLLIVDIDEKPYLWNRFNFGGLPSIIFISPRNEILYGYSGLIDKKILRKTLEMVLSGETEKYDISLLTEETPSQENLDETIIYKITNIIEEKFDWVYGGFVEDYKYIHFWELYFLLNLFLETGVRGYALMFQKTLDQLSLSELRNSSMGGFYRYAKNMNWSSPEKKFLIEINADIFLLYASAYRVFNKPTYGYISEQLEKFINRKLFDGEKSLFIRGIYGDVYDNRCFFSLNMYTIEKILETYKLGGRSKMFKKALGILERIYPNDKIKHRLDHESSEYYLSDIVYMLRTLLVAYETTGKEFWIERWKRWMDFLDKEFVNIGGAYNDIPKDNRLFADMIRRAPLKENALLAENMLRYSYLFNDNFYKKKAYEVLKYYSRLYGKYGFNIGEYANACLLYFRKPLLLYVYRYRRLNDNVRKVLLPNSLIKWVDKGKPGYIIRKSDKAVRFKINRK